MGCAEKATGSIAAQQNVTCVQERIDGLIGIINTVSSSSLKTYLNIKTPASIQPQDLQHTPLC